MATNGNNGPRMTYTGQPDIGKGISGQLQGRAVKNQFSQDYWAKEGYLNSAISELEKQQKLYEKMNQISDQMTKRDQKAIKDKLTAYNQQLNILKAIKDEQEVSDVEALQSIKDSNKLLEAGQRKYIELLNNEQDIIKENADIKLDSVKQAEKSQTRLNKLISDQNVMIKNTSKALSQATNSWSDSISNSLDKAGNKLRDLSNMLSLSSIANNSSEQILRQRLETQSSVMKQLGFTSSAQYDAFRQSAKDTLWQMNQSMDRMFNTDDMYKYFDKLATIGINNQKLAESQLKASIIGRKYLGVSDETQAAIFKFMKNTNDYDMLDKHNKTIAGLLKAQLGVSKEQLDKMSQTVYSDAEVIAALGGNADAYTRNSLAAGAVIDSVAGTSGWGDVVTKTLGQIVTAPLDELGEWAKVFGNDVWTIRELR